MKIIKEEIINIKPFKKIKVGDPLYFDELYEAINNKGGKTEYRIRKLIADEMIQKVNLAAIQIQEVDYEDEYSGEIYVCICQASNEPMLDLYLKGQYYSNHLKKHVRLGCDTASFLIFSDGKTAEINTLSDGYYGDFLKMDRGYGMYFDFSVTTDAYSYDEMKEILLSLFSQKNNEKDDKFIYICDKCGYKTKILGDWNFNEKERAPVCSSCGNFIDLPEGM